MLFLSFVQTCASAILIGLSILAACTEDYWYAQQFLLYAVLCQAQANGTAMSHMRSVDRATKPR